MTAMTNDIDAAIDAAIATARANAKTDMQAALAALETAATLARVRVLDQLEAKDNGLGAPVTAVLTMALFAMDRCAVPRLTIEYDRIVLEDIDPLDRGWSVVSSITIR
jgi:hypothetical protein